MAKIAQGHRARPPSATASTVPAHPGSDVVDRMIELGRPSRLKGAGFYEYDDGRRRPASGPAWPRRSRSPSEQIPFADVKDRMLFVEALETAKCFEEGVIESAAAANIGSIMGIGFPPITGGAAQFMTGYEDAGDRRDRAGRVRRPGRRARRGVRRPVPAHRPYLRELAEKGESLPGLTHAPG